MTTYRTFAVEGRAITDPDALALLEHQAAEIERLKEANRIMQAINNDLTSEGEKADALLRQALEALKYTTDCSAPMTQQQNECWPVMRTAIAAIKQHLGEV